MTGARHHDPHYIPTQRAITPNLASTPTARQSTVINGAKRIQQSLQHPQCTLYSLLFLVATVLFADMKSYERSGSSCSFVDEKKPKRSLKFSDSFSDEGSKKSVNFGASFDTDKFTRKKSVNFEDAFHEEAPRKKSVNFSDSGMKKPFRSGKKRPFLLRQKSSHCLVGNFTVQ